MSSKSSVPCAPIESSSPAQEHQRAKQLGGPRSHDSTVRQVATVTRALVPDSSGNEEQPDSVNIQAARMLRVLRAEAGLTQEQLALRAGYDAKTVGLRERASVDLGALRTYVILLRAVAAKQKGGLK